MIRDLHQSFIYTGDVYQFDNDLHGIYQLNLVTGNRKLLFNLPFEEHYSFLAFNEVDSCVYAYHSISHLLCRIDQGGNILSHPIPNLPSLDFQCGCISHTGLLYLYESLSHRYYIVDLCSTRSDSPWELINSVSISPIPIHDWCFNSSNDMLYGIVELGQLTCIHPKSGHSTSVACIGLPSEICVLLVCDYSDYLYAVFANDPHLYRLKKSNTQWIAEIFCTLTSPCYTNGTRLSSSPLYLSYSSAPEPYAMTLNENMARHGIINLLRFESDFESPMPPIQLNQLHYSYTVSVSNLTDTPAFLYAWIDFNNNGCFELSESINPIEIPPTFSETTTSVPLRFDIPAPPDLVLGDTYMRLRLTTDELILDSLNTHFDTRSLGPATDGMVRDIKVSIIADPPLCTHSYNYHCLHDKYISSTLDVIDPSRGSLTYKLLQPPTYGKVILDSFTGNWEYTPCTTNSSEELFTIRAISSTTNLHCDIPIFISIDSPTLKLTTTCSHLEASYDTILTYTSTIENTGNITLSELNFKCVPPLGTSFVEGSLSINRLLEPSSNPVLGVHLNHLGPNEVFILSFDFIVNSYSSLQTSMQTTVEGTFIFPDTKSTYTLLEECNPLPLSIYALSLDVLFNCVAQEALIGDSLLFNIKLTNTGDLLLKNITLSLPPVEDLIVENKLIINHCSHSFCLTEGYTIPSINPNETIFIQFSGTIDHTTQSNLECLLFVDYDYSLNNTVIHSTNYVFSVILDILIPRIHISQVCHSTTASIGDILHYTITLENEGQIPITNSTFLHQFPSDFQVTKILVNEAPTLFTSTPPIPLGQLLPQSSCIVEIYTKILNIPKTDSLFRHTALFTLSPKSPNTTPVSPLTIECVDTTGVLLIEANMLLEKNCNVSEACVNEVIEYTILAKNTGTVALYDIIIHDPLSPELEFVSNSVSLNQVLSPHLSIISGVQLDTLPPGDSIILTFKALVLSKGSGTIENIASAHYTFFPNNKNMPKLNSLCSNDCSLSIIDISLEIEGSFDKTLALLNDTIQCSLTLKNAGTIDLFNIMFTAHLHSCFILNHSFFIDNKLINNVDLSTPIHLGTLSHQHTIHITYQLQLKHSYLIGDTLDNIISCNFAYNTTDAHVKYGTASELSLSLPVALSSFKLVGLENHLELPDTKPDIELINSVSGKVDLFKSYIISTPEGISSDGQILTGKILIVHGILNLSTDYVCATNYNPVNSVHSSVPFSSYIIVPEDTPQHVQSHINPVIKNISFKAVNNRSYFVHTTLLLTAHLR